MTIMVRSTARTTSGSTDTSSTAGETAATGDGPTGSPDPVAEQNPDGGAAVNAANEGEGDNTPPVDGDGEEVMPIRIKYTGSEMHTRILSKKDFKDAGGLELKGVNELEWNPTNNHIVALDPEKMDNAEQIAEFLTKDPTFKTESGQQFKMLEPGKSA